MEKNRIRPVINGKSLRMSYSRQKEVLEMPNLIEVQKNSYNWFLEEGLKEVFADISPIADYSGHLSLEFTDFTLCEKDVKYSIPECKERDATYAAPLKVKVRLYNKEADEINEHEIFMGDLPLMTETLHATGTHAGYPHKGTGPIEALATMVLALQTIVSRNVSPFHPLVLSITEMHGGHVWNVVPDKASFQGTVRYFHKSDGELVEKRFKQQVQSIAAGYGITADIDWDDFQNPLVSDTELSKIVADNVRDYAQLEPIHPSMAGEDFCDFMPVTMPVFAFIGSNGEEGCPDWHSPHFVGLDESLQAGVEFYANAALTVLNELS